MKWSMGLRGFHRGLATGETLGREIGWRDQWLLVIEGDVSAALAGLATMRKAPNIRLQAPEKHQVLNPKSQIPNPKKITNLKLQISKPVVGSFWDLEVGIFLGFGIWDLELPWSLKFEV
jgi:hypothetical protein